MSDDTAVLTLPDEAQFKTDIQAINNFQKIVHSNLIAGQDYGIIPGTTKPTLLKPGAEKISKLLKLCDHYILVDRQENWESATPFFRYLVKCQLIPIGSDIVVSEGLGECNSMESKYRYRWLWPNDLPDGFNKNEAVKRKVKTKNGMVTQFRIDNDDIFSQVNTILKMGKKRALVDAALSAGRLSNVFTQDIEDMQNGHDEVEPTAEKPAPTTNIDMDWLKDSLIILQWADVGKWLKSQYGEAFGASVSAMIGSLSKEHQAEFVAEVQKRLEAQGK